MSMQHNDTPLCNPAKVRYCDLIFIGMPGYRVGDDGSIWTRWQMPGHSFSPRWKRLKPGRMRWGHLQAHVGGKSRLLHRLVLLAFVGPCPAGMCACHNDGNPANNRLENLRWDTPEANQADSRRHGTVALGERKHFAKLTEAAVREARLLHACGKSYAHLASQFGVSVHTVYLAVTGRTWKHVR